MKGIFRFSIDNNHFGYIIGNKNKYDIDFDKKNKYLDEDEVEYVINNDNIDDIKIIARSRKVIPGVLCINSKVIYGFKGKTPLKKFIPINSKYPHFYVPTKINKNFNSYALITFLEWNDKPIGKLHHIVGKVGEYEIEKIFLKYYYDVKWKKYPPELSEEYMVDLTPNREDYTDKYIFSIDPIGCKDIDDAFHITEYKDTYEIGVHIADVSSFIEESSNLDNIIRNKSQSIYLNDEQINMLPDILATDKISLIQYLERRSFSVIFIINKVNYQINSATFKKSIIINKNKLSYEDVENKYIGSDNDIDKLYNIGKVMYDNKNNKNNFINFNDKYDSHKMVEFFMVLTNSYVAREISKYFPDKCILRTHTCKNINILKINDDIPKDVVNMHNILQLERANYVSGISNIGHWGLGEEYYTHFTSPIRRYIDIVVHRLLYASITNLDFSDNLYYLCDCINIKNNNIKNLQRDYNLLEIIYNFNYDLEESYIYYENVYIVYINDANIGLYIKPLNIVIDHQLFSRELVDSIVKIEQYDTYSKFTSHENSIEISLFQKVKIEIHIAKKNYPCKKKILISMIDPNIDILY